MIHGLETEEKEKAATLLGSIMCETSCSNPRSPFRTIEGENRKSFCQAAVTIARESLLQLQLSTFQKDAPMKLLLGTDVQTSVD